MQFEIIGADNENFYLMAFDKKMEMSKGVFFYKTPINFFDFIDLEQSEFYFELEVELFVARYYDLMVRDNLLEVIGQDEFMNIEIEYEV